MRIITNFEALDISEDTVEALRETPAAPCCTKAEAKTWAFQALSEAFNDQTNDPEAYLADFTDDSNFIFGALDPENLVSVAKAWNQEIKEAFVAALTEVGGPNMTVDSLPIDTDKTYALQCAARELDNNWWCYAPHGVYLPNNCGFPYFRCTLTDEELKIFQEFQELYPEEAADFQPENRDFMTFTLGA